MLATLTGTAASEIEADVLRLTNGTDGLVLRAAPEGGVAPAGLEGAPWLLDSIIDGSTTSAIAAGVRRPTLLFDAGTVTVDTGCNTGSGTYTMAGDQITFGPIAMTLILCEGVTGDVEQADPRRPRRHGDGLDRRRRPHAVNGDQGLHYLAG